jgi:nucleotide-binding universal stress UspA family protein
MRPDPARRLRGPRWLAGAAAALACGAALAGGIDVEVRIPVPEKIDATGMSRLLVGGFRSNDHPTLDLDQEVTRALRSLLRKGTRFEVLDVDPLPLPEQSIEEAIRNTSYWKRVAARTNADLIVAGTVDFGATDRSGFVERDYISELTGHRQRQTVWVERESFRLDLGLYFFRGSSGELLYEDHFTEEALYGGKSNDDLTALHETIESLTEGILSILTARSRVESRYLFTE